MDRCLARVPQDARTHRRFETPPRAASPYGRPSVGEPLSQAGLLASGLPGINAKLAMSPDPSAAPSHPFGPATLGWSVRAVADIAAVVAGYSGASAADFHGLPFWPLVSRDTCNDRHFSTSLNALSRK